MALLTPTDVLFAHKALNVVPGLSANARRVGGAIIDHFNKKTGQCNPSVERLAALLEIDRATVLRATAELSGGACQLFDKLSHGGKSHCASYTPRWEVYQEIVATWDMAMKTGEPFSKVAELRRSQSQSCDVEGRKTATQTLRRNPLNEPLRETVSTENGFAQGRSGADRPVKGLGKKVDEPQRQRHFMLPIAGGKPVSHTDAARRAADKRLWIDLQALGADAMQRCVERMTPQDSEAATVAEMRRRGGGLAYVLDAVHVEGMRAHG